VQEEGYDAQSGRVVVKVDPQYFRPAEVEYVYFVSSRFLSANAYTWCSLLLGDPAKAERILGWKRQVDFDSLVKEMVNADLKATKSLVEDQNWWEFPRPELLDKLQSVRSRTVVEDSFLSRGLISYLAFSQFSFW
jgi:hypothetical protein